MLRTLLRDGRNFILALLVLIAPALVAQGGQGVDREKMWPAPTAEDWARPCLITWQRSWEDALAVAQETSRPILICVNMDGEIASEHYAGIRYRQPDIAALYQPYVAVIASVYRHTPRDHDQQGHRIPCPRFGTVTCGEHIAIEPKLFAKYFDGRRIAPRHIMIELDGSEAYDVMLTWDTASVFKAVGDGIANRKIKPKPVVRGDRSIIERVASPDVQDRMAVEAAYRDGDRAMRRALLEAARARKDQAPVELLRLGIYGLDLDLARRARESLAKSSSAGTVDLISDVLRAPLASGERDSLVGALARLGKGSRKARRLATVHRGLSGDSQAMDVGGWSKALGGGASYASAVTSEEVASRLEKQDELFESKDAGKRVDLAEAFLKRAIERKGEGTLQQRFVKALFEDARNTAIEAESLGARGWRVNAVVAVASLELGDASEAHRRAAVAVGALPDDPADRTSMLVLALFAEARHDAIVKAVKAGQQWPGKWLADMHAAHTLLLKHPEGADDQAVSHYDFLRWLGARRQAARFLDEALERFSDSLLLHARLRRRALRRGGVEGMEAVYVRLLAKKDASPNTRWFAGLASIKAAEFHRRRGRSAEARGAYARAMSHFDSWILANKERRPSADHYVALALGGRARISLEQGLYDDAVKDVIASFERKPDAAATRDGLNLSAVDTAKMLLARLREKKLEPQAKRLDAAMKKLDPDLLKLPEYENVGPRGGRRGGARRARRPPRRDG